MPGGAVFVALVVLGFVIWFLVTSRRRQAKRLEEAVKTAPGSGLSTVRDLFEAETGHRAPVADFHVRGEEITVAFDVPLPGEDDPVLIELLMDEAVEVVREKRHSLPIQDATVIVVMAGRGHQREIGRTTLPSPGVLPVEAPQMGLSLSHVAHDPFAAPFDAETDHSVLYETKADVPDDELGPLIDELRIPKGLDRGLRALGVDPDKADGHELVLALLKMFGYTVSEQAYEGSYIALKGGVSTYLLAEPHQAGEDPQVSESVIRRFLADFDSSGADRGMLVSAKYAPFMVHEIEGRQPKVRFITRERIQRFIDSMSMG